LHAVFKRRKVVQSQRLDAAPNLLLVLWFEHAKCCIKGWLTAARLASSSHRKHCFISHFLGALPVGDILIVENHRSALASNHQLPIAGRKTAPVAVFQCTNDEENAMFLSAPKVVTWMVATLLVLAAIAVKYLGIVIPEVGPMVSTYLFEVVLAAFAILWAGNVLRGF